MKPARPDKAVMWYEAHDDRGSFVWTEATFIEAHPTMQGIVFDRPAVLEGAEWFSRKFGLPHRIQTGAIPKH